MTWTTRDLTVAEAAELCGFSRARLDVIIGRLDGAQTLFSAKKGGRRWFSPRDVSVLAVAHELERFGSTWLAAVGAAYEALQDEPAEDAILVATLAKTMPTITRTINDRDVSRLNVDKTTLLIPHGRLVADIAKRSAQLTQTAVA
ncbi:hypothetical protein LA66_14005 [Aureimonas altamirensis]|uniref:HTH merR-type domain-containing protein n=1 Tax=Aureimonas altamirensis TaxID=370622 RepID=A0A0B1Q6S1_9HYPH|nr:hypothetical protein [Aureimonas altamirensis]KHJ54540.1 hypothetical protein LA66_14005 [Aureimonas altamirensis]